MREEAVEKERVLLVGVDTGQEDHFERSMEELGSLAQACGMEVAGLITQKMGAVNKTFYIGSGKVEEVREYARDIQAGLVVFDNSLTPSQLRNLNDALGLPVMDRTNLILDIFAARARTREARLQVETARLQYLMPRLVGMRDALGRQGGASGSLSNKGAGETRLELDRRRIGQRISELKKELEGISRERETQRKKRSLSRIPQVALVGYTNAGKSTILNRMVDLYGDDPRKRVLEEDMLFATLETSVRYIEPGDHRPFFLVDTVGFIHKLPHDLIKAFQSTLEEVKYADLLIQVVDFSDPEYKQQMEVTANTLKDLGAADIPMILAYNKSDRKGLEVIPRVKDNRIYLSAVRGAGIRELTEMVQDLLYAQRVEAAFLIPYDKGFITSYLCQNAAVLRQEYLEEGTYLQVSCHRQDADRYAAFRTDRMEEALKSGSGD